ATVCEGAFADGRRRVAERSVLVFLILKDIRIDGAGPKAVRFGGSRDGVGVREAARKVPQDVECNRRAAAGQRVHMTRVADLFLRRDRGGGLQVLPEARPRVGEPPPRELSGQ